MIKTVTTRLLLLSACSVGVMTLLAIGFSRGFFSPRGLGIGLLISGIAICTWAVLIIKKTAKGFPVPPGPPPGTSIDAATRKHLMRQIRVVEGLIVLMVVGLVSGLSQVSNSPLWESDRRLAVSGLVVGVVMNLLITAVSVRTVIRLKKKLRAERELSAS